MLGDNTGSKQPTEPALLGLACKLCLLIDGPWRFRIFGRLDMEQKSLRRFSSPQRWTRWTGRGLPSGCQKSSMCQRYLVREVHWSDTLSHHDTNSLDMPQIQRLGTLLLSSPVCGLQAVPVHAYHPLVSILLNIKIVFQTYGALFSAIWAFLQQFVLQYHSVLLAV